MLIYMCVKRKVKYSKTDVSRKHDKTQTMILFELYKFSQYVQFEYDFEKKLINGGKLKNSIMKPVTKSTLNPINYRHNDHLPHGKDEKILQKLMSMKIPISQTQ
jgi:hypothetical protein